MPRAPRSITPILSLVALTATSTVFSCSSSDGTTAGSAGTSSSGAPSVGGSAGNTNGGNAGTSAGASGNNSGGNGNAGIGGSSAGTGGGGNGGSNASGGDAGTGGVSGNGGASGSGGSGGGTLTSLGQFVITWYTFQDNTPVNSALSASGRHLLPYVSVAVPFTQLKEFGGNLDYGDKLYLEFLAGRTMPNGKKHSGWVEIDDFCGDNQDDTYCYQEVGGKKYPNTDLYIGDFTKSGMAPNNGGCSGPAGGGQELTNVSTGDPGSAFSTDYGGAALGSGKCGDKATARSQQLGPAGGGTNECWAYDDQPSAGCDACELGVTCMSK